MDDYPDDGSDAWALDDYDDLLGALCARRSGSSRQQAQRVHSVGDDIKKEAARFPRTCRITGLHRCVRAEAVALACDQALVARVAKGVAAKHCLDPWMLKVQNSVQQCRIEAQPRFSSATVTFRDPRLLDMLMECQHAGTPRLQTTVDHYLFNLAEPGHRVFIKDFNYPPKDYFLRIHGDLDVCAPIASLALATRVAADDLAAGIAAQLAASPHVPGAHLATQYASSSTWSSAGASASSVFSSGATPSTTSRSSTPLVAPGANCSVLSLTGSTPALPLHRHQQPPPAAAASASKLVGSMRSARPAQAFPRNPQAAHPSGPLPQEVLSVWWDSSQQPSSSPAAALQHHYGLTAMLGSLLGPALEVSSRAREVRESSVLSLSPWRAELSIALAPSSSTADCTSSCSGWVKLVVPFSVLRGQAVVRPLLPKTAGRVKCFELLLPLRCPPDVYQEVAAEQQSSAAVWPLSSARANDQQCWARGLDWTRPNPRDCTGWSSAQGAASVIKLELWQHGDTSQGACQLLWWMAQCGLVASPSGVPRSLPGCTAGVLSYIALEWMQRPELPTWSCRPVNSTQDLPSQLEAHIAKRLPFRVAYALLSLTSCWLLPWELVSQPLLDMLAHADPIHAESALLRCHSLGTPLTNRVLGRLADMVTAEAGCLASSPLMSASRAVNCNLTYHVLYTPTRRLLMPPELELSNRVLREYGQHRDRFMRVNFGNEAGEQLMLISTRNNDPSQLGDPWAQELLKRMGGVMVGGVKLLGLPYELLAFSTNQLRSASAWFLAPFLSTSLGFVNAQLVRTNVGDFSGFTNRAKLAARLGQAFSCTVPVLEYTVPKDCSHEAHASGNADSSLLPLAVQQQIDMRTKLDPAPPRMMSTPHALDRVITDYQGRVQYTITDGVGRMGMQVAADIMAGLGRKGERPLAVQVRYQGCKGMLVPWPANSQFCDGQRGMNEQLIQVRPSMDKFESQHTSVEVCQVASFIPGYLNRQIIMLLLALGKNTAGYDEIFMTRAEEMIADLDAMLVNRVAASDMLRSLSCLGDHLARVMQAALLAGLDTREPLLQRLLSHVRLHSLQMLRAKHRIKLPNSAFLFGVIDETGVLSENEVFVQVQRPGEEASVLESQWVLITKNPCLHPGDIRVLRGVRCPPLMHLVNVVVFPMNVERPHANTIAGSDLDGDQYFCCWDTPVVPLDRWGNPVHYVSAAYDSAPAQVTPGLMQDPVKHLTDLFKEFQVNNNLGIIANAWVALADGYGAEDGRCLELSYMHSMAVDYAKTGVPACLKDCTLPSKYPHFMENPRKPSYPSENVLGRVYERACQEGQKVVPVLGKIPTEPDPRLLLTGQPGWEQELEWAVSLCKEYNIELIKLLNKYGCMVEEELLTGWVLDTMGTHKQKRMDLRQQLLLEMGVVRRRFLHVFHKLPAPGSSQARTWPSLTSPSATTMASYDILEDAAREAVDQGPGHHPTGGASTERTLSALAREEAAEQGQPVTEQAQSRRQRRSAAWLDASLPGGAQPVNRGQVVRASAWYCAAYDPQYHPAAAAAERQAASRPVPNPSAYSEYNDEEDDEAAAPTQGLPSTLAAANPTGFRLLSFGWLAMDVLLKGLVQAGELQVPAADSNPQPPATTSKTPRRPRPAQPAASMAQPVSVAHQLGGSTRALFGDGNEAQLARALQDVFARMNNWNIR